MWNAENTCYKINVETYVTYIECLDRCLWKWVSDEHISDAINAEENSSNAFSTWSIYDGITLLENKKTINANN